VRKEGGREGGRGGVGDLAVVSSLFAFFHPPGHVQD